MKWTVKWWNVARDVAVLLALNYASTVVALLYIAVFRPAAGDRIYVIESFNKTAIVLGFLLAGCWGHLARVARSQHIAVVCVSFWLTYIFQITVLHAFVQWSTVFSFIPLFALLACVGGGVSLLFAPPPESGEETLMENDTPKTSAGNVANPAAPEK